MVYVDTISSVSLQSQSASVLIARKLSKENETEESDSWFSSPSAANLNGDAAIFRRGRLRENHRGRGGRRWGLMGSEPRRRFSPGCARGVRQTRCLLTISCSISRQLCSALIGSTVQPQSASRAIRRHTSPPRTKLSEGHGSTPPNPGAGGLVGVPGGGRAPLPPGTERGSCCPDLSLQNNNNKPAGSARRRGRSPRAEPPRQDGGHGNRDLTGRSSTPWSVGRRVGPGPPRGGLGSDPPEGDWGWTPQRWTGVGPPRGGPVWTQSPKVGVNK